MIRVLHDRAHKHLTFSAFERTYDGKSLMVVECALCDHREWWSQIDPKENAR